MPMDMEMGSSADYNEAFIDTGVQLKRVSDLRKKLFYGVGAGAATFVLITFMGAMVHQPNGWIANDSPALLNHGKGATQPNGWTTQADVRKPNGWAEVDSPALMNHGKGATQPNGWATVANAYAPIIPGQPAGMPKPEAGDKASPTVQGNAYAPMVPGQPIIVPPSSGKAPTTVQGNAYAPFIPGQPVVAGSNPTTKLNAYAPFIPGAQIVPKDSAPKPQEAPLDLHAYAPMIPGMAYMPTKAVN